ncbi:MAG: 2OG-Fe(II) oxygenase [Bacteroidota bacterium]
MLEDNIETILGDKYTKEFLSNGSKYSKTLKKDGIIVFNNFININGLGILKNEAKKLKQLSFKSTSEYNVYVSEHDPNFSDNSPRNRIMSTSKKCIPNDLIPRNSYLQLLYDSKLLKQFFCDILQKEVLFPYEDTLSSININYYDKGDALGWHFDNSDYTITLLIKNCEKGGIYEFFNDIRYLNNQENYDYVEKILDKKVEGIKVKSYEGDLMIFMGNKSIHQVSAVEKGERILVTFNYNETRGVSLSEQSRRTFFGRIK